MSLQFMHNKPDDHLLQIEDLISIISHELKSPIMALKIQTQLLQRHLKKSPLWNSDESESIIVNYDKQLVRLQHFVDSILESTRLEKQIPCSRFTCFNLNDFLNSLIEYLVFLIPTPEMHLKVNLSIDKNLVVFWDQFRMEQVITNLLLNAFKYAQGSDIFFEVSDIGNNLIEISVKDHGPGISPKDQDKIFEKFHRLNNLSSTNGGLGLGLFIVKKIVEAHKG